MAIRIIVKKTTPPPPEPPPEEEGEANFTFDETTYEPPEGDNVDFIFST